jgi:hypothetical protein
MQGSVVWDLDLGFEQLDGPVVASANGQLFAIPTFRWGSGKNDAPDQLTARVFGLKSKTSLLTLSVPRNFGAGQNYFYGSYGDTRFGWGGLALSPEGDLLAVKSGASVQVYRVPEVGSPSQCGTNTVAVFEGKSEEDLWTTYIVFPKPNVAIAATNEDYLREVLARIDGKRGERALPETLPEWKHVNTSAQFWAVRHYRITGAETDPTSPFNRTWGKTPDPQAIGLTFSLDLDKSTTATITYLSGDENGLQRFQKKYFTERGPAVTQMRIQYREVEPGALEGAYDVEQIESADSFVFVLEALLGASST